MQSGSDKCVPKLAEQQTQAEPGQRESGKLCPPSTAWAHSTDVGMDSAIRWGSSWLCTWCNSMSSMKHISYNPAMLWSTNVVFGALQELGELLLAKSQTEMSGKQKEPMGNKGSLRSLPSQLTFESWRKWFADFRIYASFYAYYYHFSKLKWYNHMA